MNAYEIGFVTFKNLYRSYFLYAKDEKEAVQETKKVFPRLSEIISINKLEVSK